MTRPALIGARSDAMAKVMADFLAGEALRVADQLVAEYEQTEKAATVGTIPLDWSELAKRVTPHLEKIYKDGVKAAAKDLDVDPFNRVNEAASRYARERSAEMVGKKWVDTGHGFELVDNPNASRVITDQTRDTLRRLTDDAFQKGMTPDELRQAILDATEFSPARAKLIADTELADAQSFGTLREWDESGVVEKKGWLLSGNHAVDDDCDTNADAGEIALNEKFPSGVMTAPAHPGCDCDVYAVTA